MNSKTRRFISIFFGLVLAGSASVGADVVEREFAKPSAASNADDVPVVRGSSFTARVAPTAIQVDLRDLPVQAQWKPGDPVRTIPRRRDTPQIVDPKPVNQVAPGDPLLQRQKQFGAMRGPSGFTTPLVNLEGQRSGSNPHDPNGEVGPDFFVQAINGSGGTRYTFYDKTDGTVAAGPFTLSDLASSGPCTGGLGDPIVLFDEMASRWVLTEFSSSGNRMCVYVAQTDDPIAGGWFAYDFEAPSFPDYPKYGVWSDAYYVGTNETSSTLYAFERGMMLQGLPAGQQRFTITDPAAFGFAMIPPIDHDGLLAPPNGAPGTFIRHFDDEAHDPGNNDPDNDRLQIFEMDIDWSNAANSTLTGPIEIDIAEIDSEQCGFTAFECYPQPGTSTGLDPLREVVMNLPKYRNFGTHETIVGNLVTDVSGNDQGGVRWFELRRNGGSWSLHQEGTFAPDIADGEGAAEHRWMAGSAIDETGNIAIGFNLSNDTNIFPSLTYAGRLVGDQLGVLSTPEVTIVDGTASHTSSTRWGDYSSMSVDPVDGCTFWFTSNYGSSASAPTASTRFASFKFDSCGTPTFLLSADNTEQQVCVASGVGALDDIAIDVGSVNGFVNQVDLAFNPPLPPGFSGAIVPASLLPPGAATASIDADGSLSPGDFVLNIEGTAVDADPRSIQVDVNVADSLPPAASLQSPGDGALSVQFRPIFSWTDADQAVKYRLEVATDPGFNTLAIDESVAGTSFQPDFDLDSSATYYWRVTPANQCGDAPTSAVFSFTTLSAPGDCSIGSTEIVYFADDIEAGDNGWTHSSDVGPDTWVRQTTDANSPETAWQADDIEEISDQRLVSPVISLPASANALTLQYFARRGLEDGGAGCFDGGLLEYTSDGGQTWSQVGATRLQTNPYTGPVDGGFGNPLAGSPAWCGIQDWTRTVVDLGGLEGLDVQFRYRLGTDSSVPAEAWRIDDVSVQSCEAEAIFSDGFESPAPL